MKGNVGPCLCNPPGTLCDPRVFFLRPVVPGIFLGVVLSRGSYRNRLNLIRFTKYRRVKLAKVRFCHFQPHRPSRTWPSRRLHSPYSITSYRTLQVYFSCPGSSSRWSGICLFHGSAGAHPSAGPQVTQKTKSTRNTALTMPPVSKMLTSLTLVAMPALQWKVSALHLG